MNLNITARHFKLTDAIRDFAETEVTRLKKYHDGIIDGEVDEYPEAAFNLVGTLEDAIEKGKKLMEAAKA